MGKAQITAVDHDLVHVFGQLQMIYVDLSETWRVKSKPAFCKASKNDDSYISSPAEAGIHWDR